MPRRSKYTEKIEALRGKGLSRYQIARELGLWPSQVYTYLKRHKGKVKKKARKKAKRVYHRPPWKR